MNLKEVVNKRLEKVIELVGDEEYKIDKYLLKNIHPPKLDPIKKKKLVYPRALFPVENAPLEWWYFTGHLESNKKRKFGFEFCIFKIHPEIFRVGPIPLFALKKKPYLVLHATITDKDNDNFVVKQKTGIIHENSIKYNELGLKLGKDYLEFDKIFHIKNELLDLKLEPLKKIVKHFDEGFTINHEHPQARTYYLSFTRMKASGRIKIGKNEYKVSGISWFDHQKCNMIRKSSLVGWDWFSLMLKDKTELMFYRIRDKKGISHKHLGVTYVDQRSRIIKLRPDEIKVVHTGTWKSPKTCIVYPSGWNIEIPKLKMNLNVEPCIKNQEIDALKSTGNSYWEGACSVSGTKGGKPMGGDSYVELVGYDKRLIYKIIRESIV